MVKNWLCLADLVFPSQGPMMPKMPQMDLIAELKKRQVKPQVTDGAIEDIITGNDELQEHCVITTHTLLIAFSYGIMSVCVIFVQT